MTTMQYREALVSGDWLLDEDEEHYRVGYRARVPRCPTHGFDGSCMNCTWNGWAIPFVTRAVLERMTADQEAFASANPNEVSERWTLDGDTLIIRDESDGEGREYENRIEPGPDGLYDVQNGWTWSEVEEMECLEIVGAA